MTVASRVWVLYREASDGCLVIGVFAAPALAMRFVERFAHVAGLQWSPPQPGRQYWMLDAVRVRYIVEAHRVHDAVPPFSQPETHIVDLALVRASRDQARAQPPPAQLATPDDAGALPGLHS
jgi:hypothetical protein